MPNDKDHLYGNADVTFDAKRKNKINSQQQFSRFSVSSDSTIIDIANRAQNPALQGLTKPQIGNPYNDTIEPFGLTTEAIPFNVYGSEYSFLTITGDADIFPDGIPQGSFIEYVLDIVVDSGGPSITIQFLNVLNPPVLAGNDGDHYILKFVAVNRADDTGVDPLGELTIEFIGPVIGGGGGGVSFPIDFPELDMGSPTVSTTIDMSQSDRHFRAILLSDDLQIDLTNIPPGTGSLVTIYFTQDGIGGHVPTIPLLNNSEELDNISTTPGDTTIFTVQAAFGRVLGFTSGKNIFFGTSVSDWSLDPAVSNIVANGAGDGMSNIGHLDFINNLATPVAAVSLYSDGVDLFANTGGGVVNFSTIGGGEFFGPMTANHDYAIQSIINLAAVAIVDTGGLPRGTIFGDAGNSALGISLVTGGKFQISDIITPILEIDDATGLTMLGSHGISMGNNLINLISELQFAVSNTHTPSNEVSIAFDFTDKELKYAVALTTDVHSWYADTDRLASIARTGTDTGKLVINAIDTDVLVVSSQFLIAPSSGVDPGLNGEFRLNGTSLKVFTDGVVKNLSDIGVLLGANTSLSNLTTTSINQDLLFNATGFNIGSSTFPVDQFSVETVRFQQGLFVSNLPSITSISGDSLDLHASNGANINFDFEGFGTTHIFTPSSYTSPNIIVNGSVVFQDALVFPTANGEFKRNGNIMAVQSPEFAVVRDSIVVNAEPAELSIRKLADSLTLGTTVATLNFQSGISSATTWADLSAGPVVGSGSDASFLTFFIRADNSLINAVSIQGNDNDGDVQFLFGANDPVRLQPLLQPMGYFVTPQTTDFLTNLGTSGSLEIPQINDGSPSLNDLNQAAGAFDGMIVHDIFDGDLYIRANSGRWDRYARTGTVV